MAVIDRGFNEMMEQRNHFEHWHTRLRSSLKGKEYDFSKKLLNVISETGHIPSKELIDLAEKHQLEDSYKDIVGSLNYNGYINNNDDSELYRYNSPILRQWWRQYVAH